MKKKITTKRDNWYTKNYFFVLSLTILILGIIAFSDNFLFDIEQESNSDPLLIMHGIIMFTWYFLVVVQANHVRKLNIRAHKALGITSFLIAILVIISIAYLNYIDVPYSELPFFGKANRIFLPVFAVLIVLAYIQRKKHEFHKHALFVAILLMMEPLLSRVGMNTGTNAATIAPVIWLTLWLSLFIYDFLRLRTIHFLTYSSLVFWFLVYAVVS